MLVQPFEFFHAIQAHHIHINMIKTLENNGSQIKHILKVRLSKKFQIFLLVKALMIMIMICLISFPLSLSWMIIIFEVGYLPLKKLKILFFTLKR